MKLDRSSPKVPPTDLLLRRIKLASLYVRRHGGMNAYRDPIFEGLDVTQIDVLDLLTRQDRWRMIDLARALHLDKSTMTRTIQRLERQGLVKREEVRLPGKGRSVMVRACVEGSVRFTEIVQAQAQILRKMLEGLTEAELEQTAVALEWISTGLRRWLIQEAGDDGGGPEEATAWDPAAISK